MLFTFMATCTNLELNFSILVSWKLIKQMNYFHSTGCFLGMTIPIVNSIDIVEGSSMFEKEVLTAYYLPAEFQDNPPQPSDPEVTIVFRPPFRVLAR